MTAPEQQKDLNPHPAFELLRTESIASLNLRIEHYRHLGTGAEHYHLASDNPENVFLVGLRTVPTDSTGVAHILEHTALCGSEKYPVRDPFFMMLRRSLNTFMNAFTSSDWTAYPFASQNRKDFFNLLDVYLDAVFFSRLDPLDFAQEGHRLEFSQMDNPHSELEYKGVVFNEMKGAMSSPASQLWQRLTYHLYPTTTYHFNSGGEPEDIPDLSYQQLQAFYRKHYHPGNAVFMTYGNLPAAELQRCIETAVLSRFEPANETVRVGNEKRYQAPRAVQEYYPLDEAGENKTHHVLGWLLGESSDLTAQLEAHLLANVLLQDSSSPLRQALETSALGSSPSPLCGLEDSNREMCFVCGLEGSAPEHAEAVERLIFEVLERVAREGVPHEKLEAVLHQLELSQREVRGDGMPYGLQLILAGLPAAVHGGDPIAILNLDPVLERLRALIQDPDYIKGLVTRLLLQNRHRVRLTLCPDLELSKRKDAAEQARLVAIKAQLTEAGQQEIMAQSQALAARQQRQDDESILPKVTLADIPASIPIPTGKREPLDVAGPVTYYDAGTNGLVYQEILLQLPQLPPELLQLLPLYADCLTELGLGKLDYLQVQSWQSAVSGGLSAGKHVRSSLADEQHTSGYFVLAAKALRRNQAEMNRLLFETLTRVRFDEIERIEDLVAQRRAGLEQSITGRGHALAMQAASSGMNAYAAMTHRLSGLAGIKALKQLDDSLKAKAGKDAAMAQLTAGFQRIHALLLASPLQFLVIGEAQERTHYLQDLQQQWQEFKPSVAAFEAFALPPVREQVRQAWSTSTQVNFCAKSYATVPAGHADAPVLAVLGEFMKNGFLHSAIRERGGAYGSVASQDSDSAAFRLASYRDPRLQATLEDFDRAIDWLLTTAHAPARLEEAILGVVGSIDKPGSPAGEVKKAFHGELHGRTAAQRREFRARILDVSLADLQRVGETYLHPSRASLAVLTNAEQAAKLETEEGYERFQL